MGFPTRIAVSVADSNLQPLYFLGVLIAEPRKGTVISLEKTNQTSGTINFIINNVKENLTKRIMCINTEPLNCESRNISDPQLFLENVSRVFQEIGWQVCDQSGNILE